MVRRKATRVLPRNKPQKPDVTFIDESDADMEHKKENLEKRLEDFDRQVEEIVKKMESDKESVIKFIKDLYFIDEQRTPSSVNNMLWRNFLEQNTVGSYPKSAIRESIAELVNGVEETTKKKKPKHKGAIIVGDDTVCTQQTTRSMRTRNKNITVGNDAEYNVETTVKSSRLRKLKEDSIYTPLNQGASKCLSSLLITPKFDPRTPLPMHTLRKPKFGEIAVSLKGSPLQVAPRDEYETDNLLSDLDSKTKEELQLLHEKVAKLLEN